MNVCSKSAVNDFTLPAVFFSPHRQVGNRFVIIRMRNFFARSLQIISASAPLDKILPEDDPTKNWKTGKVKPLARD